MGRRVMADRLFYNYRLGTHVPADHPFRNMDALLDISFTRRVVAACHSATGQPSVKPELTIHILLIDHTPRLRRLCGCPACGLQSS